MSDTGLTLLEAAVLKAFHDVYASQGFPDPSRIAVRRRRTTGAGRCLDLIAGDAVSLDSGYYDMGGRFIRMEGLAHGLMAVAVVEDHRLVELELATYGDVAWDGIERDWTIEGTSG